MAGMSRDKCGAADVAGFLKVVSILKPKNVKVTYHCIFFVMLDLKVKMDHLTLNAILMDYFV
jgi:hypothetical protein